MIPSYRVLYTPIIKWERFWKEKKRRDTKANFNLNEIYYLNDSVTARSFQLFFSRLSVCWKVYLNWLCLMTFLGFLISNDTFRKEKIAICLLICFSSMINWITVLSASPMLKLWDGRFHQHLMLKFTIHPESVPWNTALKQIAVCVQHHRREETQAILHACGH